MKTLPRFVLVLLLVPTLALTGCALGGSFKEQAREIGASAAEGAMDAARPKLEALAAEAGEKFKLKAEEAAVKIDASIQAKIDAAKDKPADERGPMDWFWIIAGATGIGTSGGLGARGALRKMTGSKPA